MSERKRGYLDMDHTQNFSGRADDYTKGRPVYADAFIEMLYSINASAYTGLPFV